MFKKLIVAGGLGTLAGSVLAEVPTEVTTALTEGKTDAMSVAGLALVIVIAIAAFKYMRRGV